MLRNWYNIQVHLQVTPIWEKSSIFIIIWKLDSLCLKCIRFFITIVLFVIINGRVTVKRKPIFYLFTGVILCLLFIVFGIVKIQLDTVYTKEKFNELYDNTDIHFRNGIESLIHEDQIIEVTEGKTTILNAKSYYAKLCMFSYQKFTGKCYINFVIHFYLIIVNIFLIIRAIEHEKTLEKIELENEVLFDPEINIK